MPEMTLQDKIDPDANIAAIATETLHHEGVLERAIG
jgi:hypothetical protein